MRQSDILSYHPDLNIYSEPHSNIAGVPAKTYTLLDESDTNTVISRTLYEFDIQSPNKKVTQALNLITKIESYLGDIEANVATDSNSYLIKYFAATTDEDAQKILNANADDMENGSTKLEVYYQLQRILKEVKDTLNIYITNIFGKDVDTESIEEIVSNYIDKMKQFESQQQYEKVNYFSLYYDTQISFLFSQYLDRMNEVSAELSFINDKQRNLDKTETNVALFKSAFDKVNKALDADLLKDTDTNDQIKRSMNNIYLIKQQIEGYLDVFSTLYQLEDGQAEIQEIEQDNIDNLEKKIDNMLRTTTYSNLAKTDLCNDLKKKSNYRSFFVT
jgi:hypothetical protein